MVGMDGAAPIVSQGLVLRDAEKFLVGKIGEFAWATGRGHPDRHRRAIGDDAEALLAFADGFKRVLLFAQRLFAFEDSAAQLHLRHHLPRQHAERERLVSLRPCGRGSWSSTQTLP